jgi:multiple sugar transport system permease protein
MFVIFRQIGLINTQLAVILATTTKTLPFAVIMLRTTFAQVPIDLEDAARVDGCSRAVAFLRVTLPLARIGYIVVGTLVFLLAYGEFVYPVSLMNKAQLQPATVGLYSFVGADYSDWGNAMAFASVFVTPVIIIFMLLQRRIVSGLTAGALK